MIPSFSYRFRRRIHRKYLQNHRLSISTIDSDFDRRRTLDQLWLGTEPVGSITSATFTRSVGSGHSGHRPRPERLHFEHRSIAVRKLPVHLRLFMDARFPARSNVGEWRKSSRFRSPVFFIYGIGVVRSVHSTYPESTISSRQSAMLSLRAKFHRLSNFGHRCVSGQRIRAKIRSSSTRLYNL